MLKMLENFLDANEMELNTDEQDNKVFERKRKTTKREMVVARDGDKK